MLTTSPILDGWPLPFYLFGELGIIWFIFWIWLVNDYPETDPKISEEEKKYIIDGRADNRGQFGKV